MSVNYPYESKLSDYQCQTCKKKGTLRGLSTSQEVVEKFKDQIWTFNIRFYLDSPPYNLECSVCKTGIYGKIGRSSY